MRYFKSYPALRCAAAGMKRTDFSRYPDKAYQLAWLRYFLEFHALQHEQQESDVTDGDVERLYVQVNKFALVEILFDSLFFL